jgi:hypothetical protein
VHPLQDVVLALLKSNICDVLAALVMIIKHSIKRLLVGWRTICDVDGGKVNTKETPIDRTF